MYREGLEQKGLTFHLLHGNAMAEVYLVVVALPVLPCVVLVRNPADQRLRESILGGRDLLTESGNVYKQDFLRPRRPSLSLLRDRIQRLQPTLVLENRLDGRETIHSTQLSRSIPALMSLYQERTSAPQLLLVSTAATPVGLSLDRMC